MAKVIEDSGSDEILEKVGWMLQEWLSIQLLLLK
jgi:hypothetical protein